MAIGRRKDRARTPGLWIATNELFVTGGIRSISEQNQTLDVHGFDAFVEPQCAPFYATMVGRPSLTPGTYFRLLLVGYFEGIDSERGTVALDAGRGASVLPRKDLDKQKSSRSSVKWISCPSARVPAN
jgi:hypothetical protein